MFLFRLPIHFFIFLTFNSFVVSVQQYGKLGKTLYVTEDKVKSGGKLTEINRNVESESRTLERRKRETTTLHTPPVHRNISTWVINNNFLISILPLLTSEKFVGYHILYDLLVLFYILLFLSLYDLQKYYFLFFIIDFRPGYI